MPNYSNITFLEHVDNHATHAAIVERRKNNLEEKRLREIDERQRAESMIHFMSKENKIKYSEQINNHKLTEFF